MTKKTGSNKLPQIKCKCPKCGKIHKMKILWIGGDYMPRKYCKSCSQRNSIIAMDNYL